MEPTKESIDKKFEEFESCSLQEEMLDKALNLVDDLINNKISLKEFKQKHKEIAAYTRKRNKQLKELQKEFKEYAKKNNPK